MAFPVQSCSSVASSCCPILDLLRMFLLCSSHCSVPRLPPTMSRELSMICRAVVGTEEAIQLGAQMPMVMHEDEDKETPCTQDPPSVFLMPLQLEARAESDRLPGHNWCSELTIKRVTIWAGPAHMLGEWFTCVAHGNEFQNVQHVHVVF